MAYTHLGQHERDRIEALLNAGHTQAEIAEVLKVHKSTVSREIRKRRRRDGRYDADTAQHKAYVKRKYSKYQGMKIEKNEELKARIIQGLKEKRSPDEIAGRMNRDSGRCVVNCKAIYKWLYSVHGERYCHLLCTRRKRRKHRDPDRRIRAVIPNLVSIHAVSRNLIRCEGDTFVSPKRCKTTASVAVVVERRSKLILGRKIPSLKPRVMVTAMKAFHQRMRIKNIVLDRGIENRYHERFKAQAYFCDPQSPHQKPLVEGSIGLMRRWFWKKGTNLAQVSHREIREGVEILNRKYRKSLGYRSADEVARERGILKRIPGEANARSCT